MRKKNPTGLLSRWVTVSPDTFVSERVRFRRLCNVRHKPLEKSCLSAKIFCSAVAAPFRASPSCLIAYRSKSSNSTPLSVFSSRYFTMTGVYTLSPHSAALPLVIARAPATTTAPSGTTSGSVSVAR